MKFFQTLHGKLSAALLALMVTVGLFLVPLTLFAVRGYSEEVASNSTVRWRPTWPLISRRKICCAPISLPMKNYASAPDAKSAN